MQYGSFVAPGWSYSSLQGWVSWGLFGGGTLPAPRLGADSQMFLHGTMQM
jgi:hypothetical protein